MLHNSPSLFSRALAYSCFTVRYPKSTWAQIRDIVITARIYSVVGSWIVLKHALPYGIAKLSVLFMVGEIKHIIKILTNWLFSGMPVMWSSHFQSWALLYDYNHFSSFFLAEPWPLGWETARSWVCPFFCLYGSFDAIGRRYTLEIEDSSLGSSVEMERDASGNGHYFWHPSLTSKF